MLCRFFTGSYKLWAQRDNKLFTGRELFSIVRGEHVYVIQKDKLADINNGHMVMKNHCHFKILNKHGQLGWVVAPSTAFTEV